MFEIIKKKQNYNFYLTHLYVSSLEVHRFCTSVTYFNKLLQDEINCSDLFLGINIIVPINEFSNSNLFDCHKVKTILYITYCFMYH